jgi:hypothetical protein
MVQMTCDAKGTVRDSLMESRAKRGIEPKIARRTEMTDLVTKIAATEEMRPF